jgi:L-lactate oxidase
MTTSRRDLMKVFAGSTALAAIGKTGAALAQGTPGAPVPPAEIAPASSAEGELKIVSVELLEEQAKKVLPPKRFAFMGPAGEGVTYRENRRAFNDFPIMPRRLQGISDTAIDLRTKILGHDLPFPMITCPMGGHGMFHVKAEVATAGGTGMAGTLYVSSGAAHKPMEDIVQGDAPGRNRSRST